MIVVDASVAIKWFVSDEPLAVEAGSVLTDIRARSVSVPGAGAVHERIARGAVPAARK